MSFDKKNALAAATDLKEQEPVVVSKVDPIVQSLMTQSKIVIKQQPTKSRISIRVPDNSDIANFTPEIVIQELVRLQSGDVIRIIPDPELSVQQFQDHVAKNPEYQYLSYPNNVNVNKQYTYFIPSGSIDDIKGIYPKVVNGQVVEGTYTNINPNPEQNSQKACCGCC